MGAERKKTKNNIYFILYNLNSVSVGNNHINLSLMLSITQKVIFLIWRLWYFSRSMSNDYLWSNIP